MNKLIQLADPLLNFCKQIGFDREWLIQQEELDTIKHYEEHFEHKKFQHITLSQLESLVQIYGDAFTGSFYFAGDSLQIDSSLNQQRIDEFKEIVDNTPTFEFRFKLDKSKLKQTIEEKLLLSSFTGTFTYKIFLFLFVESLERKFLRSSFEKLESIFWGSEAASKVILLVPEHEIYLHGAYLSILGGEKLQKLSEVLTSEIPDRESIRLMYEQSQRLLRWQGLTIQHLTPLHFKVNGEATSNDSIARAIYLYLAKILVIYTAEQTAVKNQQQYIATYSGEKQRKDIILNDIAFLSASNEQIFAGTSKLLEGVEWIYDPSRTEDALSLFQTLAARTLQLSESSDDGYRSLSIKADYIISQLKWLWKSFMEGKIDSYMNQVKALEDYVTGAIQSFADQILSMIKNLSDTMLAAVGVTLASFIAALFKDGFNPTVFRIGILAYALYVFIFPLIYNMSYQNQHFKTLLRNFNRRQQRFGMILDPAKVDEIVSEQLKESKQQFKHWFRKIIITYVTVVIFAIATAFIIPAMMIQATSLQKPLQSPPTSTITPSSTNLP
jgi:hypothetical protein